MLVRLYGLVVIINLWRKRLRLFWNGTLGRTSELPIDLPAQSAALYCPYGLVVIINSQHIAVGVVQNDIFSTIPTRRPPRQAAPVTPTERGMVRPYTCRLPRNERHRKAPKYLVPVPSVGYSLPFVGMSGTRYTGWDTLFA